MESLQFELKRDKSRITHIWCPHHKRKAKNFQLINNNICCLTRYILSDGYDFHLYIRSREDWYSKVIKCYLPVLQIVVQVAV